MARPGAFNGNSCGGYAITFLSGALAGRAYVAATTCSYSSPNLNIVFRATRLESTTREPLLTQAEFDSVNVGDHVMMGYNSINDSFSYNYIEGYWSGIMLYGMGFNSQVVGNIFGRPNGRASSYSAFQQSMGGRPIMVQGLCGLNATTKSPYNTNKAIADGLSCAVPSHTLVAHNSTTEAIVFRGKTFSSEANTLAVANSIQYPHTAVNNVASAVTNIGWTNQAYTAELGLPLALSIGNNHEAADGDPKFVGGDAPTSPEGYRPRAGSPLINGGTALGLGLNDFDGVNFESLPTHGAYRGPYPRVDITAANRVDLTAANRVDMSSTNRVTRTEANTVRLQ